MPPPPPTLRQLFQTWSLVRNCSVDEFPSTRFIRYASVMMTFNVPDNLCSPISRFCLQKYIILYSYLHCLCNLPRSCSDSFHQCCCLDSETKQKCIICLSTCVIVLMTKWISYIECSSELIRHSAIHSKGHEFNSQGISLLTYRHVRIKIFIH